MRLIDADKIPFLNEIVADDSGELCYECEIARMSEIDSLPTVDAAPIVHAHWKRVLVTTADGGKELKVCCSHCGKTNKLYVPPYCPYCGARMDEEV